MASVRDHGGPVQLGDLPMEGESNLKMTIAGDEADAPQAPASDHTIPVQLEDLPVEGESGRKMILPTESTSPGPASRLKRKCPVPIWICLLVLGVALTVGIAIGVSGGSSGSDTPPVSDKIVRSWIEYHGYSSSEVLAKADSPQSKAVAFMVEGGLGPPLKTDTEEGIIWMEKYVLSVFYYATNGRGWATQIQMNSHRVEDVCEWHVAVPSSSGRIIPVGASCNDDGRVDALQIFNLGVRGSLPTELGLLTDLEYIVLPQNSITGSIPSELASMSNLQVFDLQQNAVTGSLPDLQSWSKLRYFNCIYCRLSGSIPDWIHEWTSLITLGLTQNKLTGTIPDTMSILTNLEHMALDDNFLTGDIIALEGLTGLVNLYLEKNAFLQDIDDSFLNGLTMLQELDISDNALIGQVPVHLMSMNDMRVMDLHDNDLTRFPDEILSGSPLEFLALQGNPIAESSFPNTVLNLAKLEHLDLSSTKFQGEMPDNLGYLTTLRYLFLADTSFLPGTIPENYQRLTLMVDLSLKSSGRTGEIPAWIEMLDKLFLLDLDSNSLSSTIPDVFGGFDRLRYLLLQRNDLLEGEIPSTLIESTTLGLVMLDQTNVTGNLNPLCDSPSFWRASSNCNFTDAPVVCSCCQICCNPSNPGSTCDSGDRLAQYDPEWEDNYVRYEYDFTGDYNITRL